MTLLGGLNFDTIYIEIYILQREHFEFGST